MLIDSSRVAAGGGGGNLHIRDAGDDGPNSPGRSIAWGKAMIKEDALVAHARKIGGGVQGVPPHTAFVGAEGFAYHHYHIGPA